MIIKKSWFLVALLSGCQSLPSQNLSAPTPENSTDIGHISAADNVSIPLKNRDDVEEIEQVLTPQEQTNLWKRIAMQLSLEVPDNEAVEYYRQWYIDNPIHLQIVSQRAEPFLYLITKKVEARHLPLELVLLPVVESSFDPFAYSSGNAVGLWQFIPETGTRFGLAQNYWYDGRRDVNAATDAALDYLTYLNKRFDGDWNLAIAAYNSGGGRVSSAITRNQRLGKPTDLFSLDLPKETSSYVPKLLALADVIANKKKYGVTIPAIPNKPKLKLVDPKEQLDLITAASYANISVEELQNYNPAYTQSATAPRGQFKLLIPIEQVDTFKHQVKKNRGHGIKLDRYKVQSGDTVSTIAQKYNTTTQDILDRNQLSSSKIKIGQYLMIPANLKPSKNAASRSKIQALANDKKIIHTVKNGDTLWSIANKYQVRTTSIACWNDIGVKQTLKIGQKLIILEDDSNKSKKVTANPTTNKIMREVYYNVRSGDTLNGIAQRFKVKTDEITKWNNLNKKAYLKPGQKLVLHVHANAS